LRTRTHAEFLQSAGVLWLGFAMLLFFAIYPLSLYKVALGHNQVRQHQQGSSPFSSSAAQCIVWNNSSALTAQLA
jgi:hypothetical protein